MVKIRVKWNKQVLETELDPETVTSTWLKQKLHELSGVPTERMKVMGKGMWKGVLKDNAVIAGLTWKEGQLLAMMGTSAGVPILERPKEEIRFVEDMSAKEQAATGSVLPPGLANLGNTCFLNSTVQCLKAVPEIRESLSAFQQRAAGDLSSGLTTQLRSLYAEMDSSVEAVTPMGFVTAVRQAFPEFAQLGPRGQGYQQQDADEFLSKLYNVLKGNLTHRPASFAASAGADGVMDTLFGVEFSSTTVCEETDAEPVVTAKGGPNLVDTKLTCNVGTETAHINAGLLERLDERLEKQSSVLGRSAQWKVTKRVSGLPRYLMVTFSRFYWKMTPNSRDHTGVNCKKLKPVAFPSNLDVYELCDENLKRILKVQRDKAGDAILAGDDLNPVAKKPKTSEEGSAGGDTPMADAALPAPAPPPRCCRHRRG